MRPEKVETDPDALLMEKMFNWFDAVCDASGREPPQLKHLSDDELLKWMKETAPKERRGKAIAMDVARRFLGQYVVDCS